MGGAQGINPAFLVVKDAMPLVILEDAIAVLIGVKILFYKKGPIHLEVLREGRNFFFSNVYCPRFACAAGAALSAFKTYSIVEEVGGIVSGENVG